MQLSRPLICILYFRLAAITPYTILAGGMDPTVQQLASIAVGLEADAKLNDASTSTMVAPSTQKKKCSHCGHPGHVVDDCCILAAEKRRAAADRDGKRTPASTMSPASAEHPTTAPTRAPTAPGRSVAGTRTDESESAKAERMAKIVCHRCKKLGHYATSCPDRHK